MAVANIACGKRNSGLRQAAIPLTMGGCDSDLTTMDNGFTLASVLLVTSGLFCLSTLFFGTKGGFYDSDDYDGNGTAH
jgi:hypothetical protein